MVKNVIYDRTFDASCMERAGEIDWAKKIILRLKAANPGQEAVIDYIYNGYLSLPYAEYIAARTEYMLEHKDTMRLRFK